MLGEYLGELQGKVITKRVIDVTNNPTLEITVLREGKLKDVDVIEMASYETSRKSDGTWHAHGKGFLTTVDNNQAITHQGNGIGKFTGPKVLEYRGSLFFNKSSAPTSMVTSSNGKLGFLDNLVTVFEVEDNVETTVNKIKLWGWK